ncbi:30S ribosomal protein S3ae [Candidatus Alkanophaga liquidiphilum]
MVRKDKWRAKQWYEVVAPEMFGKIKVGETLADDPKKLMSRKVEMLLSDLTNDIKNQNLKLILQICDVDGNVAHTKLVGHVISRDYLRSLVRRRSSKVDTYINVTTKDGYIVRIKASCFTLRRARRSQEELIRKIAAETISERAKKLEFSKYMQEVILGKLASDIYKNAKKIYPLRRVEVFKSEVLSEGGGAALAIKEKAKVQAS